MHAPHRLVRLTRRPLIIAALLLAAATASWAQTGGTFLSGDAQTWAKIIPKPAPEGSPERRTEMAVVLWLQKTRTQNQVAFVDTPLDLSRFAPILGADLLTVDGVALSNTLNAIITETETIYDGVKAIYGIKRPFVVNDAVKHVGNARPEPSYPSGHAIRGVVYAGVLGAIFPDHKDALEALGKDIGYGRVIAGVHYPSDVSAGQTLGAAFLREILASSALETAMGEIKPN